MNKFNAKILDKYDTINYDKIESEDLRRYEEIQYKETDNDHNDQNILRYNTLEIPHRKQGIEYEVYKESTSKDVILDMKIIEEELKIIEEKNIKEYSKLTIPIQKFHDYIRMIKEVEEYTQR